MLTRRAVLRGMGCGAMALTGPVIGPAWRATAGFSLAQPKFPRAFDEHLVLFVDDHDVAEQQGLKRIVRQAIPLPEPIFAPHDPLHEADFAWGNVLREPDGRFRLWYGTMMMGDRNQGPHEMSRAGVWGRGETLDFKPRSPFDVRDVETCLGKYAESEDGMVWHRPNLGQIEFRGSKENNILLTGELASRQTDGALTNFDGYTILRDDAEPDSQRRYKMIAHWESVHFWDNHEISGALGRPESLMKKYQAARGEYLTCSPDGLHWDQPLQRLEFPNGSGDRMLVVRDGRHQRWWANTRAGGWSYPALATSEDLQHWSEPELVKLITPDSVHAPAVESMIPFNYGGQDLAFPCGMDKPRGILFPLLASRREGQAWEWVENERPFIPFGPPGSYHATGAMPLHNEPWIVGDELYIYFNAFSRDPEHPCPLGSRSIGLAKLRRDGFAGMTCQQKDQPGSLTLRPLTVTQANLEANVEILETTDQVQVALLDPARRPLAGYGLEDAVPIRTDGARRSVRWKNQENLAPLLGQEVSLEVRLRGSAVLYALAFS